MNALDSAANLAEHQERQARESVAPCRAVSEMTAKCDKPKTLNDAIHDQLAYQGQLPNYVDKAANEEEGRVKSCSAGGGGLLSLGCILNMPHFIAKAVRKAAGKE